MLKNALIGDIYIDNRISQDVTSKTKKKKQQKQNSRTVCFLLVREVQTLYISQIEHSKSWEII